MRFNTSILVALAMVPLVGLLSLTGCSGVLPGTLEEKLATNGTEEDYRMAAKMYQKKARELEAEAVQYETAAAKVSRDMDPKGFERAALRMGGQKKRHDAKEMLELSAAELGQARALHSKTEPQ
ncbi:MAG: hypothetical protein ACREMY_27855 [bacterium]